MTHSILAVLSVLLACSGRADTDLCTFGPDRDVHQWLSKPKGIAELFCGKKAKSDAQKSTPELKKRLLKDGYHVTLGPKAEELTVSGEPSFLLAAALARARCKGHPETVSVVCVSLKETSPFERIRPTHMPEPLPDKHDGRKEGQTHIF